MSAVRMMMHAPATGGRTCRAGQGCAEDGTLQVCQESDHHGEIDVASGEMLAGVDVVELVAEPAVSAGDDQVQDQGGQRKGGQTFAWRSEDARTIAQAGPIEEGAWVMTAWLLLAFAYWFFTRPIAPRCVNLKPVGSLRPYPRDLSMLM